VKGYSRNTIVKYNTKEDKLVIRKINGKKILLKDLYSKWDDRDNSKTEINTEYNVGGKSTIKPIDGVETKAEGKNIEFILENTKGKKIIEVVKERE